MKSSAHPGEFVKTEILAPLGLSVIEAAAALGVTRAALSDFPDESGSLSGEMAVRIEKAFGISMETLIEDAKQCRYCEGKGESRRYYGQLFR